MRAVVRTFIGAAAICHLASLARAGDQGDPAQSCDGNTFEMVECLKAKTAQWDKRMTIAYQRALKDAAPQQHDQLRAAQRLWIQYRDANCLYYGLGEGTIARIDASPVYEGESVTIYSADGFVLSAFCNEGGLAGSTLFEILASSSVGGQVDVAYVERVNSTQQTVIGEHGLAAAPTPVWSIGTNAGPGGQAVGNHTRVEAIGALRSLAQMLKQLLLVRGAGLSQNGFRRQQIAECGH